MKFIKTLTKDSLIRGSLVLFIMINIYNFLNYVFHFSMARILGPADYGILAVLMSIVYIFAVSSEAVLSIFSRYTSKLNADKKNSRIKNLLKKGIRKGFKISLIIFLVYIPFSFLISFILKINIGLIFLTGFLIFSVLIVPIIRGVLQGTKRFSKLGISMISESVIKISFAVILTFIGFKVYGAILGVLLGVVISMILGLYFLKDIIRSKEEPYKIENVYSYGSIFLIAVLSITLMFSVDILIARRFFPQDIAGKYSIISILGKMIFFGTLPITKAMFPFASESHDNQEKTRHLFYKASGILILLCLIAVILFAVFPEMIIQILFGSQYVSESGILVYIGLGFCFLAFTNLTVNYALSKNYQSLAYYLPVFVINEIILLIVLSSDLNNFAFGFLFSNLITLIGGLFLAKK